MRNIEDLNSLKNYYLEKEPNVRNYVLITLGLNTALRISDLLSLRWKDVYNFAKKDFYKHIRITEEKTKKETIIAINKSAKSALIKYKKCQINICEDHYLFHGNTPLAPLSRSQAFRIIKHACDKLGLPDNISCHSLRKTFGYHAWKSGAQPALLMNIYNHSSFQITKRYLGIEQDERDDLFLKNSL